MTDLRAAILARCDELEQLARAASPSPWSLGETPFDSGHVYDADGYTVVSHEGDNSEANAALLVEFGPAAVLELVAGAREMCELHTLNWQNYCEGCGAVLVGDDPSLRAAARMIGVTIPA